MKKILVAFTALMAMAFAGGDIAPIVEEAPAPVTKNFYVGINGQALVRTVDTDIFDGTTWDEAAYGIGAQAGWVFFRTGDFSTAVEGRYTYSWDDDGFGDTGVLSAFLKPAYDFGPVTGYALIGYSDVDVDTIGSTDGFAWGLGISGDVAQNIEVFVYYTVNPDFNEDFKYALANFDHEVITIGLNYKF